MTEYELHIFFKKLLRRWAVWVDEAPFAHDDSALAALPRRPPHETGRGLLLCQGAITTVIDWVALKQQNLSPTVLEAGTSKIKAPTDPCLLRVLSWMAWWCLHTVEGERGPPRVSLIRSLVPFMRLCPPNLITSPKPHLQMPSLED
jgi:hypothetical protein